MMEAYCIRRFNLPVFYGSNIFMTFGSDIVAPLFWLRASVANGMNINRFCYLLQALAATGCSLLPHPLVTWFLLANLLTLVFYGVAKMAARKAWRRVP